MKKKSNSSPSHQYIQGGIKIIGIRMKTFILVYIDYLLVVLGRNAI